ncbi:hypothetical protein MAR_030841 [Mya arenaria]|uniref:Uncharacterized protein n=1 Tax=Mya arenaria TaxID=6604 RepID=A0ABY7F3P7_MYAAR|nr:hypothetical protein MAR_030841 [Mya arenaria]
MSKTNLKFRTYKAVFPTALPFRRKGKQDRPNHFSVKLYVPAFKKKKTLLDPKRALYWYLQQTGQFINNIGKSEFNPFIAINRLHRNVPKLIISKWIVIQIAYESDSTLDKVIWDLLVSYTKRHLCSLLSVLEAADGSRETTFVRFHLRNIESSVYTYI